MSELDYAPERPFSARDSDIFNRRSNGESYESIATDYGIAKSWVRIIYLRELREQQWRNDHPLFFLGLRHAAIVALEDHGVVDETDLALLTDNDLLSIPGIGIKAITLIRSRIPCPPSNAAGDDTPIESTSLSTRTKNCLRNSGIETVGDLAPMNDHDLLKLRMFGRVSLAEIRNFLPTGSSLISLQKVEREIAYLIKKDPSNRELMLSVLQRAAAGES